MFYELFMHESTFLQRKKVDYASVWYTQLLNVSFWKYVIRYYEKEEKYPILFS